MCGIVGIASKNQIGEKCYLALEKLEYRGYDSAGFGYLNSNEICIYKKQGRVLSIKDFACKSPAKIAIAHTRWATHGKPSEINSHPHLSKNKEFALVHNGIIENYQQLKKELGNVKIESETDTAVACEVIANQSGTVLEKLKKACDKFVGSFAFALLKAGAKEIYVAKRSSPLYVAKTTNGNMVASDIMCFSGKDVSFYCMQDGEFAVLSDSEIKIYNHALHLICPAFEKTKYSDEEIDLKQHKHFMEKEIYEIPAVFKRIIAEYSDASLMKNAIEQFSDIDKICIVACGTAYHAGLYGAKILKNTLNIEANGYIASEFIYDKQIINEKTLAIFVSQSGETADTIKALEKCKAMGAKTLSITNATHSTLARMTKASLNVFAGKEIGVASTKAYVAQVLVFYILAMRLKNRQYDISNLKQVPTYAKQMLNLDKEIVGMVAKAKNVFFIGREYDYISSLESALKLKEIAYKSAEGYPAGELKHGTLALVEEGTPVFVFNTNIALQEKTKNGAEEVATRGGKVVWISPKVEGLCKNDKLIELPENLDTEIYSLLSVIPMFILAYETAVKLSYNPDKPRNLAKSVTVE